MDDPTLIDRRGYAHPVEPPTPEPFFFILQYIVIDEKIYKKKRANL